MTPRCGVSDHGAGVPMVENDMAEHDIKFSRRTLVAGAAGVGLSGLAFAQTAAPHATTREELVKLPPYGNGTIGAGIRSRLIDNVNGLTVHILEAGYETPGRQLVYLMHGMPELAYSWRKIMPVLAAAGYHVIAPDQRGYGGSDHTPHGYDPMTLSADVVGIIKALGETQAVIVGQGWGGSTRHRDV